MPDWFRGLLGGIGLWVPCLCNTIRDKTNDTIAYPSVTNASQDVLAGGAERISGLGCPRRPARRPVPSQHPDP